MSGGQEPGDLESGGLEARTTDLGAGIVPMGFRVWGLESRGLEARATDLASHMPVLKKSYIGPLLRSSLFRECKR